MGKGGKIRRKIYLIFATVLIAILTVPFFGATMEERRFNSEEELRHFLPNQYFFHFDLRDMELLRADVAANTQTRWGCSSVRGPLQDDEINWISYVIVYSYESEFFDKNVFLNIGSNFHENISKENIGYDYWIIIDEIKVFLRYGERSIIAVFELNDSIYQIWIQYNSNEEQLVKLKEYFLSIITPAIIDRQKGENGYENK